MKATRTLVACVGDTSIGCNKIKPIRPSCVVGASLVVHAVLKCRNRTEVKLLHAGSRNVGAFLGCDGLFDHYAKTRFGSVDRMRFTNVDQVELDIVPILLVKPFQLTS